MKFKLVGHINYRERGVINLQHLDISDDVFADSLEQAITISRAFIKSRKQKLLNSEALEIDALRAVLSDENENKLFIFELVKEKVTEFASSRKKLDSGRILRTVYQWVEPEHIKEQRL